MPNWLRPIVGWLMPRVGPRGLEFARARVEMKAVETVLHLRRRISAAHEEHGAGARLGAGRAIWPGAEAGRAPRTERARRLLRSAARVIPQKMPHARSRQMHLGVFVLGTGNHIAGWRWPGAAQSFEDLSVVQEIARTAERGKFDLIFLGDNLSTEPGMHPSFAARFEPLTMLAALAATTTRVGLGATSSTTYNEPYTVARQFASLDHLSGGRAAWNAVTSSGERRR